MVTQNNMFTYLLSVFVDIKRVKELTECDKRIKYIYILSVFVDNKVRSEHRVAKTNLSRKRTWTDTCCQCSLIAR